MWAGWHCSGGIGVYTTSSGSGSSSASHLIKAAIGTVAICVAATSAFLSSPPPASTTSTSGNNILRRAPYSASFYTTRARARPTTAAGTIAAAGGLFTDQQIESYSFRDIIGDKLLAVEEDADKGVVTREVSAKEILKGKHVAIYFANTDMEEEQERARQQIQKKKEGVPDYVRSISIVKQAYQKAKEAGKEFEVVYVPLTGTTPEVLKDVPFVVTDEGTRLNLMRKAGQVCMLPNILVEDDKGEIVTRDGFTNMLMFPDDFPWKNKSIKQILSPSFVKLGGEEVDQTMALEGKTLGVYLDASWSDACKDFTPILKAAYAKLRAEGKPFEVVSIVLRPRSQEEFLKHIADIPWFFDVFNASPDGKSDHVVRGATPSPAGLLGSSPVSTLLLFDEHDQLITAEGRDKIVNDPEGENFPWQPKPWPELPEDVLATFGKTSFLVFMEGMDKGVQTRIREVVKKVAESRVRSAEEEGRVVKPASFFTVSEAGSHSKRLRKEVGLNELNEPLPRTARVALLDSVGGRAGVKRDGELTEESLAAFVAAWDAGEIMLQYLQSFKLDVDRMSLYM